MDLVIPPDLPRTVAQGHSLETCPQAAGKLTGSSFYLRIKIDCDQFGFWISPDERLSKVVL